MKSITTGRKLYVQPIEKRELIVPVKKEPERKLYIQPIVPVQKQSTINKPFLFSNRKEPPKRKYYII